LRHASRPKTAALRDDARVRAFCERASHHVDVRALTRPIAADARARMVNVECRMRTQTDGRAHRAIGTSLWDRGELRSFHTRCDVCRAPARTTRGGMLLCRDCADAARPHQDDDAYDDVSAGD
jgi:hypothetical protein